MTTPDGGCYSYAALDSGNARYANLIGALGVRPSERVAVQIDKSPYALMLYLTCLRAGVESWQ